MQSVYSTAPADWAKEMKKKDMKKRKSDRMRKKEKEKEINQSKLRLAPVKEFCEFNVDIHFYWG